VTRRKERVMTNSAIPHLIPTVLAEEVLAGDLPVDLAILILADLEIFLKRFSEVDLEPELPVQEEGLRRVRILSIPWKSHLKRQLSEQRRKLRSAGWKYVRLAAVPEQSPVISLLHAGSVTELARCSTSREHLLDRLSM